MTGHVATHTAHRAGFSKRQDVGNNAGLRERHRHLSVMALSNGVAIIVMKEDSDVATGLRVREDQGNEVHGLST